MTRETAHEAGLRRNGDAVRRILLNSHRLTDVGRRDQGMRLFGRSHPAPLVIAPTRLSGTLWADGDVALARVAANAGISLILSTAATTSVEEVVWRGGGEVWLQLYVVQRELGGSAGGPRPSRRVRGAGPDSGHRGEQ